MADILRLKTYRTFMLDGRSSVTYDVSKGFVAVAVLIGYQPVLLADHKDECPVDDIILDMAKHITAARKREKKTSKVP